MFIPIFLYKARNCLHPLHFQSRVIPFLSKEELGRFSEESGIPIMKALLRRMERIIGGKDHGKQSFF